MKFVYDDGGREAAGFRGDTGDCVVRAIAIVTERDYREVYDEMFRRAKGYAATRRDQTARAIQRIGASPRNGTYPAVYKQLLRDWGLTWTPTMFVGSGCKVHVRDGEVPAEGRHVLNLSGHLSALVDGVLRDTYDTSRDGTRCVYGYWSVT